jgi:hypothetical protein
MIEIHKIAGLTPGFGLRAAGLEELLYRAFLSLLPNHNKPSMISRS